MAPSASVRTNHARLSAPTLPRSYAGERLPCEPSCIDIPATGVSEPLPPGAARGDPEVSEQGLAVAEPVLLQDLPDFVEIDGPRGAADHSVHGTNEPEETNRRVREGNRARVWRAEGRDRAHEFAHAHGVAGREPASAVQVGALRCGEEHP